MAKENLKERLRRKQHELRQRGSSGNIVFLKPDTTIRVRILNMGKEEDFVKEVTQFYLGGDIKGIISPATFNEPCAVMEAFLELKESKDDSDKQLAKKFNPRKRYLAFCAIYKDLKGKEVEDNSPKFVLLTNSMYQDVLDLYLDEDDWGDMTDPIKGYDLKLKRTGSGKNDTEYSVIACQKSPCPKPFDTKIYNLDDEVRKSIPSYDETKEILDKFLGTDISEETPDNDGDSDDEEPKKSTPLKKKKILPKKRDLE